MDSRGNFNHLYPQTSSIHLINRHKHLVSLQSTPPYLLLSISFILQALCLFRLAAKLEHKAAALKAEALQHLFIALAGSDCKQLWTLLVSFFSNGTGFDPFDFLDGAPIIKPPLDSGDTDSNEEASETASSVSLGSISTTASTHPTQASTSTASPQAPHPILKPRPAMPDKISSIEYAEACIPTSLSDIHHTGIPPGCLVNDQKKQQPMVLAYISIHTGTLGPPLMSMTFKVVVPTFVEYISGHA